MSDLLKPWKERETAYIEVQKQYSNRERETMISGPSPGSIFKSECDMIKRLQPGDIVDTIYEDMLKNQSKDEAYLWASKGISEGEDFHTGLSTTLSTKSRIIGKTLLLEGLNVDAVNGVCENSPSSANWFIALFSFVERFQRQYTSSHKSIPETLWRTLVLDQDMLHQTYPVPDHYYQHFHDWAESHLAWYISTHPSGPKRWSAVEEKYVVLRRKLCDLDRGFELLVPDLASIRQRQMEVQAELDRDPLLNVGIRLLDLALDLKLESYPLYARDGDEIWIIPGLSMPIQLRPITKGSETTYQHLSACYVHGIMRGEFMGPGWEDRLRKVGIV
ncbi:uncharacterized protein BDZ99DRAFT_527130 [Mytilinidion resinicola]|uniref:Heterokaryon incompatibility domain-containing protein n=1 Tax=Mytilinidion resinicola TaxID=574789 RepID=A0A6A6Y2A6_9PEZI|nr:uncharacterized protein BDZ99DRAFT_527130 [Mytilinidion resinicola]KAF2802688.1 hypothetical protein BDZ99DRAFT_527130 [Mytilinidion resinicola]